MHQVIFTRRIALLLAMLLGILVTLEFTHTTRAQTVIVYRVDQDAPGPLHDGLTWTSAYTTLQDALTQARTVAPTNTLEIWVAKGVYYPDEGGGYINNDPGTNFSLINNVSLYGGFGGFGINETTRSQRNWATHLTVLSGDIDQNDRTDPRGIVTATASISGSNAYHVVTANTVQTATVDGFAITAGKANGADFNDTLGGGMYNEGGNLMLTNVTFSGNLADRRGGGMLNASSSNSKLVNVTFDSNSAGTGGGMANEFSTSLLINVTFISNRATFEGGGMYDYYFDNPTLINVIFHNNTAAYGGGIANTYCIPTLINVTFHGNSADSGGGIYNYNSSPMLINNILWDNMASNGAQIYRDAGSTIGISTINYSLVEGGCPDSSTANCDAHLLTNDPQFVNAAHGDMRLQSSSPAIDAGDSDPLVTIGVATDRDGKPRFVDIPGVVDTGTGGPPFVDLGAFEVVKNVYLPLITKQ
ncbi:hypothetical protein TFLX_05254 [Thermoflexales bacterium]|nr:hypothetical protein TFLX_05254 [Thermoflexales bacterium]